MIRRYPEISFVLGIKPTYIFSAWRTNPPLAMAETDNFLRANIIDTVTYTQSIHNNSDLQVRYYSW